jgi:hypothetical protein
LRRQCALTIFLEATTATFDCGSGDGGGGVFPPGAAAAPLEAPAGMDDTAAAKLALEQHRRHNDSFVQDLFSGQAFNAIVQCSFCIILFIQSILIISMKLSCSPFAQTVVDI